MLGRSSEYFLAFKDNQLNGKEIKRLLFSSTINGFNLAGQHWWIGRKKNGEVAFRGPGSIQFDNGRSWIEGDVLFTQFQKRLWGVEYCSTVFRNPSGTHQNRDEYFFFSDTGVIPFSLVQ